MKTQLSSNRIRLSEISIVIPVKDNQRGINNYLSAFFQTQQASFYPKEIIIVDNNSSIPINIDVSYANCGVKIKLLKCETPGPAAARNAGATAADGEWILFNDSDCVPTKYLLSGYLKADNGSIAYAGNVKAFGNDKLSLYYESQEILVPLKTYSESGQCIPQYLITANCLIWKKAFNAVAGFNESISIAGGEDIDLGLRLAQQGDLSYAFDSIILHDFNDGIVGFYKRFKRYGKGNKIIEQVWGTNMRPRPFRPNHKTSFNLLMAVLQYLFLLRGYQKGNDLKPS